MYVVSDVSCRLWSFNFANFCFNFFVGFDGVDPSEESDNRSGEAECGLDSFQRLSPEVEQEVGLLA